MNLSKYKIILTTVITAVTISSLIGLMSKSSQAGTSTLINFGEIVNKNSDDKNQDKDKKHEDHQEHQGHKGHSQK